MTAKSIESLILKSIEAFDDYSKACQITPSLMKEFPKELKVMMEIMNILRTAAKPIIDEADLVLNVLHEVNFSCGKEIHANPVDLELLHDLYTKIDTLTITLNREEQDILQRMLFFDIRNTL